MAIDSAEKRKSVAGISAGCYPVAVTPNASKDREWRQQAGFGYSGITPSGSQPDVVDLRYLLDTMSDILAPGLDDLGDVQNG